MGITEAFLRHHVLPACYHQKIDNKYIKWHKMAVRNNDYLHLLVLGSMITQIEKN